MSVHTFPRLERFPELLGLLSAQLVAPSQVATDDTSLVLTFTPDLAPAQVQTLARLVAYCRGSYNLTAAEWLALEGDIAALRTFRQQSQAEFMALTATQRDRAVFDAINAQTNVLRALLRD